LHASGYTIKNNSYIFPGVSGSGKSTIIKILGKDNALSDELLYIFFTGSRFHAASTPFWGELKKPCDLRAGHFPIRSFLFLKHGPALELNKMNVKHSFKELLKTVMFFSSRGSDFDRLIDNVIPALSDIPSYTMYFSRNNKRKTVMKALEGI